MKAQRRHELQTNVLSIELAKIADFLRRRSNYIAWGALGVALVVFGIIFYVTRQSAKADERQSLFDHCMTDPSGSLESLKSLASQTGDKRIAALSCVALGDRLASDAVFKKSQADRTAGAEEASRWYRKVVDEFPKETLAVGKAHLGLGKLAENQRNFAAARAEYDEILRTPGLAGQPLIEIAAESLQNLPSLEPPVRLATTLPATAPAATRPAAATEPTQPATATAPAEPATSPAASGPAAIGKSSSEPAGGAGTKPVPATKEPATKPDRKPSTAPAKKPAPKSRATTQPAR